MLPDIIANQIRQGVGTNHPAYIYDLDALHQHAARIRAAIPADVQFQYAAKANNDVPLLTTLNDLVDSFEVSSLGELRHSLSAETGKPIAFGAPGKTVEELRYALAVGVSRFHVESMQEIAALSDLASTMGVKANVLVRVNVPVSFGTAALVMGGSPSPFGFDPGAAADAVRRIKASDSLVLKGMHAHIASGLDVEMALRVAEAVIRFSDDLFTSTETTFDGRREVNIGGGMNVNYTTPSTTFDWETYGAGLSKLLRDDIKLRVEPGRSISAYCGWYVVPVLDVRESYGKTFAVIAGGTHHLRTPVTKGHDQPFDIVPVEKWPHPWERPSSGRTPITVAGQLCTPKDILARDIEIDGVRAGDVIAFSMTGAYAWNISHHSFLMHPHPEFHYVSPTNEIVNVKGEGLVSAKPTGAGLGV